MAFAAGDFGDGGEGGYFLWRGGWLVYIRLCVWEVLRLGGYGGLFRVGGFWVEVGEEEVWTERAGV